MSVSSRNVAAPRGWTFFSTSSTENFTSALVNGLPSWKCTPFCSVKLIVLPSALAIGTPVLYSARRAMLQYGVRKLAHTLLVALGVVTLVFAALRMSGDPAATMLPGDASVEELVALRKTLGLDKPIAVQYAI